MCELLNEAEQGMCVYVGVCNTQNCVTQVMHRCTHLLVEHLSNVQIQNAAIQNDQNILTRPDSTQKHAQNTHTHTHTFTDAWIFARMHSYNLYAYTVAFVAGNQCKCTVLCHMYTFLYTHIHINMQQYSVVCDQAKCFVSLLQPPFIALMVLL